MNLCNIYSLKGKGVKYSKSYVACVFHYGINIFLYLQKSLNYDIMESDETNAYNKSKPAYEPLYVHVDNK